MPARKVFGMLASLAILAGWAFTLRPAVLGGPAGYVMVRGVSMNPTYHSYDLVLTRQRSSYKKGDIVAYRVPKGEMGEGMIVIHRVTGGSAATGYVIQGDNNPEIDPWRPKPEDIVGKAWVLVPQAGKILIFLHAPVPLASLAAGVAVAMVMVPGEKEGSDAGRAAGVGDGPVVDDPERQKRHRKKRLAQRNGDDVPCNGEHAREGAHGSDDIGVRRSSLDQAGHAGDDDGNKQTAAGPEQPAHVLADLGPQRRVFLGLAVWGPIGASHQQHDNGRSSEGRGVEEERRSHGDYAEQEAAEGRSNELLGADLDDVESTVRLFEVLAGHDCGDERLGGVVEEGLTRP
jgi:signal peptidase